MAAYCTQEDLTERFGEAELAQLTDEAAATTPDDAEIDKICDEASSLIDAYLATRYTTPLATVPTLIRSLACDIARKKLWKDRADRDHAVNAAYTQAIRFLKDLADGTALLPDATGAKPSVVTGIAFTTPTRVFNTSGLLDA